MKQFFAMALAVCCVGVGAPAQAETGWQWLDGSGRKVFSDLPPPPSVPDRNILLRPPEAEEMPTLVPAAPRSQPAPSPTSQPSPVVDEAATAKALETLRKRDEQIRRDNCRNARARLASLNSGLSLYIIDERGEPAVMDDAMRAAEIRRAQSAVQEYCRPLPQSVPTSPPSLP